MTTDISFSRRSAIAAVGMSALTTTAHASTRRSAPPVDYADPETNMRLLVKLLGSLDSKVTYFHAHGVMFGMRPGQHARPLLEFEGCAARLFKPNAAGTFDFGLREWLLFKDPKTHAVIETWQNPYTLETVKLPHFKGGGGMKHKWTQRGQERIGHEALLADYGPQVYDWTFEGDTAVCNIDQFIAFPNQLQPDKFPVASTGPNRFEMQVRSFVSSKAALENPRVAIAPCIETWVMKNSWMGFMNMGQWEGGHIWRGSGKKLASLAELPKDFLDQSEARWPGLTQEFSSWTGA
jgi:hypothetical protein